jgi:hypothetical protein
MNSKKPIPTVGTIVPCSKDDLLFLDSNVPCLRLMEKDGLWTPSKAPDRGLMVYIVRPTRVYFNQLRSVRILEAKPNAAHAEVVRG